MRYEVIHLKEFYPVLDRNGADPTLEMMIQDDILPDKPRPSMIVCPGGGYHMISNGEAQNVGFEYMTMGCNAFVVRYSIKPHQFPQQLIELACAVDYVVTNAKSWNGDPEKTCLIGFSAGGHLAASYCTLRNCDEVKALIPETKPVQAAILCYPVITAELPTHLGSFQVLSGKEEWDEDDTERLSCNRHVDPSITPPTFIWTTADDFVVDASNTLKYATELQKAKIPFELHIFPTGYHGLTTCRYSTVNNTRHPMCEYMNCWTDMTKKWLRTIFNI